MAPLWAKQQPMPYPPHDAPQAYRGESFPGAESYTLRLLVIPVVIFLLTGGMTVLNTFRTLDTIPVVLFYSDILNDPKPEPWAMWAFRWLVWLAGMTSILSFKRTYLPRQVQWIFAVMWVTFVLLVLTGFRQLNPPAAIYSIMYKIHQTVALIGFLAQWFEDVMLWWPNVLLHAIYCIAVPITVMAFLLSGRFYIDTGIPYIYGHPEIVLEWFLMCVHVFVGWYRFPTVSAAVAAGTWRPWASCFAAYCPDLIAEKEQCQLACPPTQADYQQVPAERSMLGPLGGRLDQRAAA